jgi:hypothetical protein
MKQTEERAAAASAQLIEVHNWLREELDRIRSTRGGRLAADLRIHCAAFCRALTTHHSSEDADVFTVLAAEAPELAPVLDELRNDHVVIAEALAALDEALQSEGADARVQFDTVAALLETHFGYEERKLAAALDASSVTRIKPEPPTRM